MLINPDTKFMTVAKESLVGASVRIGLLSRSGIVPARSGLNWGQRPGRNGNEAYIALPSQYASTGFFPEIGRPFKVSMDNGNTMMLVRCQQGGKALQSLPRNSLLGLYFRERLGVAPGAPLVKSHLLSYGRTDIEMTRLSEDEYHMNFGVAR